LIARDSSLDSEKEKDSRYRFYPFHKKRRQMEQLFGSVDNLKRERLKKRISEAKHKEEKGGKEINDDLSRSLPSIKVMRPISTLGDDTSEIIEFPNDNDRALDEEKGDNLKTKGKSSSSALSLQNPEEDVRDLSYIDLLN